MKKIKWWVYPLSFFGSIFAFLMYCSIRDDGVIAAVLEIVETIFYLAFVILFVLFFAVLQFIWNDWKLPFKYKAWKILTRGAVTVIICCLGYFVVGKGLDTVSIWLKTQIKIQKYVHKRLSE